MGKSSPEDQVMRISSPDIQVIVKASHDIQKASWEKRDEKTDSGDRVKKCQYCGSKAANNRNNVQ